MLSNLPSEGWLLINRLLIERINMYYIGKKKKNFSIKYFFNKCLVKQPFADVLQNRCSQNIQRTIYTYVGVSF